MKIVALLIKQAFAVIAMMILTSAWSTGWAAAQEEDVDVMAGMMKVPTRRLGRYLGAPVPALCPTTDFNGQCIVGSTNITKQCGYIYPGAVSPTCGANGVCQCGATACGCAFAPPTECPVYDLNFDNAVKGEYVRNKWAQSNGILISAKKDTDCRTTEGHTPWGAARVFDTADPGTNNDNGDPDLGSPNQGCTPSGPGVGKGGNPLIGTNPNVFNCEPQGKSLIIQELDNQFPDDTACGGTITFDFYHAPAFINEIGLMDVDINESVTLMVTKVGGTSHVITVRGFGNNGMLKRPINIGDVTKLSVYFSGSGTITYIKDQVCGPFPEPPLEDCTKDYYQNECSNNHGCKRKYGSGSRCNKSAGIGNVCYENGKPSGCQLPPPFPVPTPTSSPTASPTPAQCEPLKVDGSDSIDPNKVNIVFVGSGFDTESTEFWEAQVQKVFGVFDDYNMFGSDNLLYHAYYVTPTDGMESSFCYYNCNGIEQLLCCDKPTAFELSNKCLPNSANKQTIVIHNDDRYGGAGYTTLNLATTSINQLGPLVAMHELGHSLFRLADEYPQGTGTPASANCDIGSCSKWSDLIGMTPAGYAPVSCIPACMNNAYFSGGESFMDSDLEKPVGAVNERFTCCTYQALTKDMPSYCSAFNFTADYVFHYCQGNDYQGYGSSNYASIGKMSLVLDDEFLSAALQNKDIHYINLPQVTHVTITLVNGDDPIIKIDPIPGNPGLYLKDQVVGDFANIQHAVNSSHPELEVAVKVTVMYNNSLLMTGEHELILSSMEQVHVIPPQDDENREDGAPNSVFVHADVCQLALPWHPSEIVSIEVDLVDLSKLK